MSDGFDAVHLDRVGKSVEQTGKSIEAYIDPHFFETEFSYTGVGGTPIELVANTPKILFIAEATPRTNGYVPLTGPDLGKVQYVGDRSFDSMLVSSSSFTSDTPNVSMTITLYKDSGSGPVVLFSTPIFISNAPGSNPVEYSFPSLSGKGVEIGDIFWVEFEAIGVSINIVPFSSYTYFCQCKDFGAG